MIFDHLSKYLSKMHTRLKCLSRGDELNACDREKMFSPSARCWNGNRAAEQTAIRRISTIIQVFFIFVKFTNDWVQTLEQAAKLWCLAHGFIYQLSALSTYDQKNMVVDKRISGASVIVQSAATDSKSSSNPPFMSTSIQTNTVVYRRISGAVVIVQSAATNSKSSSNPPFMPPLQATRNCLFQYNLVIG